ncbi:MAG: DUF58 domain-containing protein [Betaproteobacteria bacterium]|nr:DUF58 domain-containing protein [Betaproteobacteria bacterium]
MYSALKNQLYHWIFQPRGPEGGTIVLVQRRVFILPTRQGIVFALTLLLMLVGSINYGLSLGFVLTFLLAGLGITAMLHTFRNLAHMRVAPGRVPAVFAGEHARFTVRLENPGATDRYEIGLTRDRNAAAFHDIPAQHQVLASVDVPAPRRGPLRPGRLTLFTRYPLGLFHAWSYLDLDVQCVVYPRPARPGAPLPPQVSSEGSGALHGQGQEDFSGLRQYHPGDSPRHIAWKAAARDQGLLTKQFSGRADAELWLDWQQLPATMDVEARLSQLTRWVIDAQASSVSYGLRLPGMTLPVATGEAHRERCLEALALFDVRVLDRDGSQAQSA